MRPFEASAYHKTARSNAPLLCSPKYPHKTQTNIYYISLGAYLFEILNNHTINISTSSAFFHRFAKICLQLLTTKGRSVFRQKG
jgi:hypothetical protein